MNHLTTLRRVSLALSLFAVACSDTATSTNSAVDAGNHHSDAGTNTGIAPDKFEETLIDRVCDVFVSCDGDVPLPVRFPTKESCIAYFGTAGFGGPSTFDTPAAVQASILSGKIQYDGKKMEACLAAIASTGCSLSQSESDPLQALPACREALRGTVAVGGACIASLACAEGFCLSVLAEGTHCEGKCTAIGSGPCQTDAHCTGAQRCAYTEQGMQCITPKTQNAACASNEECATGLFCRWTETSSTCQPMPTAGQECEGTCADGLACVPDRDSGTATCVAYPTAGQPCVESNCAAGLWCDFNEGENGTCKEFVAEGGACTGGSCQEGLLCLQDDAGFKCTRPATLGETCLNHEHCGTPMSLLYCNPTSNKCDVFPGVGKACVTITQAGWDTNYCNPLEAYCDESGATKTCKTFKAANASCEMDAECGGEPMRGVCVDQRCLRDEAEVCEP